MTTQELMVTSSHPGTLIYASEDVFEALLAQATCTAHVRQDLVRASTRCYKITKRWLISSVL